MQAGPELAAALAGAVGAARVDGLRRLSAGASRETWAFDAVGRDGAVEPMILCRDPRPGGDGRIGPATERALLEAAARAGVPVPPVVTGSDDPSLLGAPFLVTRRLDGETIPRRLLRDDRYAGARAGLAAACGRALAGIHAIPTDAMTGLEQADQLDRWREILDATGQAHPAFELAFKWLAANRPPAGRTTVVHGDFRNGNLLVDGQGLQAVLDWELAHLGDPIEDLGWLCVKAWRFGAALPVGGFGDRAELFDAYARASGHAVDPTAVHWWEVMGTLKWGVMCIVQAFTHLSGVVRSVELATIGRRVCENEWDLLELIG